MRKKLVLIVIDGLTPVMLEHAVEGGRAPALAFLVQNGRYAHGVSTFPSLTPVCLSSIATGAHPDVHHIPHLVWYHRTERRIVEYGSSFAALRAAGTRQSINDAVFNMNEQHLGRDAVTLYEGLEEAGYTTAVVNFTCYRGRTRHLSTLPGFGRPAFGPKRFFFYSLFESDRTGAPLGVLGRAGGSLDAYAAAVGRWLVTRDGFDLLVYYLPDYDFASHTAGPDAAYVALERADRSIYALLEAAGGPEAFLERYAVILCSDHGQSHVERTAHLDRRFVADDVVVTASNRAAMVYRTGSRDEPGKLARRLDGDEAVGVVLYAEDGTAVARRDGEELRFEPEPGGGWRTSGDLAILDQPDALERAWAALRNPNAGELIVSAASGYDFADLAGRSHAGGGSHGSLEAADSEVPLLTIGVDGAPRGITDIAPLALTHFGVEPPAYSRDLAHAA